jgi:Tfp pilus assembly protein PilF
MDRINKLKSFLEQQPNDSFLKHALALEYVKIQNDEAAKVLFDEILVADPGYVGSYFHLAKLLERLGKTAEAISVYEKGVIAAKTAGDNHAKNELQMALDELIN